MWVFYSRVEWLLFVVFFILGEDSVWILYAEYFGTFYLFVPKRRHIKFRHQRITQKKVHNIYKTEKIWNQGVVCGSISIVQNIKNGNVIYNCYWKEVFKWRVLRHFTLAYTQYVGENRTCYLRVEGFWEDDFSLRQKTRTQKFKYFFGGLH